MRDRLRQAIDSLPGPPGSPAFYAALVERRPGAAGGEEWRTESRALVRLARTLLTDPVHERKPAPTVGVRVLEALFASDWTRHPEPRLYVRFGFVARRAEQYVPWSMRDDVETRRQERLDLFLDTMGAVWRIGERRLRAGDDRLEVYWGRFCYQRLIDSSRRRYGKDYSRVAALSADGADAERGPSSGRAGGATPLDVVVAAELADAAVELLQVMRAAVAALGGRTRDVVLDQLFSTQPSPRSGVAVDGRQPLDARFGVSDQTILRDLRHGTTVIVAAIEAHASASAAREPDRAALVSAAAAHIQEASAHRRPTTLAALVAALTAAAVSR